MKNKILKQTELFTVISLATPGYPDAVTIIDTCMLDKVAKLNWTISMSQRGLLVKSTRQDGGVYLSRYIMDAPGNMQVDHKDYNTLLNIKSNLRVCTNAQNCANRRPKNNKQYKGTKRNGQRFAAKLHKGGIDIHLGTFDTEKEAALAYNEAALKYFGEFAYLNKIIEDTENETV